jgi:hypothetical protein
MKSEAKWRELPPPDSRGRFEQKGKLGEKLCDAANLVVGAGLFLSPWVLGFGARTPNVPTQAAAVSGAFIAVLSFAALYAFEVWEEWLILLAALGATVSPWIFHFAGTTAATTLLAGGLISGLLVTARLRFCSTELLRRSRSRA